MSNKVIRQEIDLGGQVAIVTGGGRGIGRAMAQELQSPDLDLGITNCAGCEMQMRTGSGQDVVHPLKLLWRAYSLSTNT